MAARITRQLAEDFILERGEFARRTSSQGKSLVSCPVVQSVHGAHLKAIQRAFHVHNYLTKDQIREIEYLIDVGESRAKSVSPKKHCPIKEFRGFFGEIGARYSFKLRVVDIFEVGWDYHRKVYPYRFTLRFTFEDAIGNRYIYHLDMQWRRRDWKKYRDMDCYFTATVEDHSYFNGTPHTYLKDAKKL